MNKDFTVFIKHILESIGQIEEYTKSLSEDEFMQSKEKQDAVIRRLEIIGEAVKNIPDDFKKQHEDIAWTKAMGTRNILIHQCFGVDFKIVWITVRRRLRESKMMLEGLLVQIGSNHI